MSEQFENSIRKKLEEADVPFDPAAWEKMKMRLDDSDRRRPVFWWWAGGLLFLLLSAGGWWWYAQQNKTAIVQNQTEAPGKKPIAPNTGDTTNSAKNISADPSAGNTTTSPGENATNSSIASSISDNTTSAASQKINSSNSNTASGNVPGATSGIKSSKPDSNNGITSAGKTNSLKSNTIGGKTTVFAPGKLNSPVTNVKVTAADKKENSSSRDNKAGKDKNDPTTNKSTENEQSGITNNQTNPQTANQVPKVDPDRSTNVNNSPVINKPVQQLPDTTANTYTNVDNDKALTRRNEKKKKRGFEGGITLGPDFNIAPSFKMGKIGFGGGLLLRYHVNNRLNISVAAVYSKKLYGATPEDYKFSYPTNYVKIDANCDVLDVPLNVHYTFLDRPKNTWSVMAGASSYFMLKEKYDYYWANNTKYRREFSNKNQHYFSVLNLGVTWEKKTPGRLKWGLQPYVKIPVQGVGEGKVKLSSAGVSLQLMLGKKD